MKFAKVKAGLLASALTISSLGLGAAHAQTPTNAYTTKFTTSITYQNVGTGAATINLDFYAENGSTTAAAISLPQLPANGATSLFVGSVSSLSAGFTGSGVLSSDQPLVATLVQLPESTSPSKNRPLSNGFSSGSGNVLIATVLKNQFGSTSKFSIQNTDSGAVDLTVKFYRAGETAAAHTINTANLPANAAKYYDAGSIAELGASFNGSATVEVKKAGTQTAGSAVGSVLELGVSGSNANLSLAFEGVAAGATKVYMASALCNFFGGQNSAYAVQNTSTSAQATVTVTYNSTTDTGVTRTQTVNIPAGGKASLLGCGAGGPGTPSWAAFSGSATIESNQPIIAIGKVSGAGLTTGFVGSTSGAVKTSLPYVRWSATRFNTNQRDRQRTFLTIQNIGTAQVTGAVVKYYDKAGAVVGQQTLAAIPAGGKANSDPSQIGAAGAEFGYYADGTSGGSAVVEGPAGSQLIVVGRVVSNPATGQVGEDYSGIPLQ
ncbi:MAG TPA: hypothetical protein VGE07_27375 [Herpetosiphonaceae bacterium]